MQRENVYFMNQKERMLANLPYKAWMDGLSEDRLANWKRIYRYNNLPPEEWDRLLGILGEFPFHHVTVHVRTMKEQYTEVKHPEAFDAAVRQGIAHPVYNGDLRTTADVSALQARCPETEAVMIGRGLLADPALARKLRGGPEADREELTAWYSALYAGWEKRFDPVLALGRIKKLMEWPAERDLRRGRLLRRARDIGGCISAMLED